MCKKFLCFALLLSVFIFCLPASAEATATAPDSVVYAISSVHGLSNSAALEGYINRAFGIQTGPVITPRNASLTGTNKTIYDLLVPLIQEVAAGLRESTAFTLDYSGDLSDLDFGKLIDALLVNLPYDLYWFDKLENSGLSYNSSHLTVSMPVAADYSVGNVTGSTRYDTSIGYSVTDAVHCARNIVSENRHLPDLEKLQAYKNAVCDMVSYDFDAAGDDETPYGNPWQLIWVFDDNPDTNVVCEGYSKAFKYLCDISSFRKNVSVSIVSGTMTDAESSGPHMWNLISMGDGKNYLADVTNCDEGTCGYPDLLFMTGYTDKDGNAQYTFTADSQNIVYTYDNDTVNLYSAEEVAVSANGYSASNEPLAVATGECGYDLAWTLDNEGWLTVSGSGEIRSFDEEETGTDLPPWSSYASDIYHVMIGSDVYSIGSHAFSDCIHLSSVSIPERLYYIGISAFSGCSSLTDVFFSGTETRWNMLDIADHNDLLFSAALHCTGHAMILDRGTCGDDLTWTVDEDGLLVISGTGPMTDYELDDHQWSTAPWYSLHKEIYQVIIQPGVTSIGSFAFINCYGLIRASLPEGLVSIGNSAFYFCSLRDFLLPTSLTRIGENAFDRCDLTDVYYAGTVEDWFSVQGVHSDAFADAVLHCSDATVTAHGTCGEQTVWWLDENGLLTIGGSGDMEHYGTVAENVINSPWFSHINDITSVAIGENVTGIGVSAFAMAVNLQSVTIPAGVTSIAPWAFHGCSGLTEILVDGGSTSFVSVDGVLYTKDMSELVCYPAGKAGTSYDIPGSVTVVRASAFWGCESLTAISIPNGVTTIGDQGFSRCGVLRFDIPDSVTSIGTYAFAVCDSLTGVHLPAGLTELPDNIFFWSQNLYDVTIPGSVTSIGSGAFSGTNIRILTLPEGITSIGEKVFQSCFQLQIINIPQSVISIGNNAFADCYNLSVIVYDGTQEQWNQINIGTGNDCLSNANRISSLETSGSFGDDFYWSLSGDGTLTVSGTGEMPDFWDTSEIPWIAHTDEIVCVVIEPGITSLGAFAFEYCANLTSVSLPDSLTMIGGLCFHMCRSLSQITLPDSLTEIQFLAFYGCESLTSFAIPANLSVLDSSVLTKCRNLSEITIDPSNTFFVLEDGVLFSADRTELICYPPKKPDSDYTVPDTVTAIYGTAFSCCENLTVVTLPASLTDLGEHAFDGCLNLTDVYFNGSPDAWDQLMAVRTEPDDLSKAQVHFPYLGSGSCGKNLTWMLDNDGTLAVSGTGSMDDYDIEYAYDGTEYQRYGTSPWYALRDQILDIAVEPGVTSVGSYAFMDCGQISGLSLPDSITVIGEGAFRTCSGLTSFALPAGVISIGNNAFAGCSSLEEYTAAGTNTAYTAENGVLFSADRSLLLAYPQGKTDPSYTVPESVTEIGALAFASCKSLTDVLLGSHVSSIGESAFEGCSSLTGLTIPDSVVYIESFAFNYCTGLTSLTVGTGLDFVGLCSFNACDSLTDVFYKGSRARWNRILIDDENGPLLAAEKHYHAGVPVPEVNLALPAALTEIESEAFAGLPAGTVVLIPDTVIAIADGAFDEGTVFIATENSFAANWATDHGFDCFEQ